MRKCSLKGVHVFVTEKPIEKKQCPDRQSGL